jgi:hypothetical protein
VADGVTMRRWRDVAEMVEVLEPLEPATTLVLAPAIGHSPSPTFRAWRFDDAEGHLLAVLCATHTCLDRWEAAVVELAPGARPALRRAVQRSPIRRIIGRSGLLHDLLDGSSRLRTFAEARFFDHPPPASDVGEPDPRVRVAVSGDIPELVRLYVEARQDLAPTYRRLTRFIERQVTSGGVLVLLGDAGEILAATRIDYRSRRYGWLSAEYVRADHRGQGLSWPITNGTLRLLRGWGLGLSGAMADTNPTRSTGRRQQVGREILAARPDVAERIGGWIEDPDAEPEDQDAWAIVSLQRRRRVPGAAQAWRVLERIEGPTRR